MTSPRTASLVLALFITFLAQAQLDRTHVQGAASPYALSSDYRALGYNPALLTHSGWVGDYQRVTGGFEGGLSVKSNLLDRTSMWDQVLGREVEEPSDWTRDDWMNALTDEELSFTTSFLSAAYARRFGKWGIAYANRRGAAGNITLSSKTAKLMTDGGLDLFSTVVLVDTGEEVAVEDYNFELGDLWEGVEVAGDATVARLLEGTSIQFQSLRTHEFGISRGWGDVMDGWALHTGVGARILLGSAYFDIHSEGDSVVAFGARSAGFSWESIQRIGGLFDGDGGAQWLNVLSPTGFGWGLDVGAVLSRSDGLWFSASVVDIGRMTWNGQEYEVNNIDVSLTDFGSSAGAIDPDRWLTSAIDLFDADSWFQTSKEAERKVSNLPLLALGAGFRPVGPVVLAGNMTVRNKEALSNGGWTGGISGGVRITGAWILETGIQKGTGDVLRFPASTRVSLENGWEIGFRTGDISALWQGAQPELSLQTCFLRYRVSGL